MSENDQSRTPPQNALPVAEHVPAPVPVYDCHVILCPPDENGIIRARVSTLEGIAGEGRSEREVLRRLVEDFKAVVMKHSQSGTPIPWRDDPEQPSPGEQQRWIPVHL